MVSPLVGDVGMVRGGRELPDQVIANELVGGLVARLQRGRRGRDIVSGHQDRGAEDRPAALLHLPEGDQLGPEGARVRSAQFRGADRAPEGHGRRRACPRDADRLARVIGALQEAADVAVLQLGRADDDRVCE